MRLGIVNEETWGFFNEIFADLQTHYETSVFQRHVIDLPVFQSRVNAVWVRRKLSDFMRANDVVFFEWASGLLSTAAQLPKTCKIITRLHRYEMYDWSARINWDAVDEIILVSHAKQKEFGERFPAHAHKTSVVAPSTSLEKFALQAKSFTGNLGILCHLTPRKRVYDLILTFAELAEQRGDLHLFIAGGRDPAFDDYYVALQHLVRDLGLQQRITFDGHVSDPWNWYSKIDVFVSNSYSEGLQVALMEAMASGCYSLSHRWDGAAEMLPAENLFYTDRELQDRILAYCDGAETDKQTQRANMRIIACEKFDIKQTQQQIRAIIERVRAA